MAMKVTAIIERSDDGSYGIYTEESFEKFALFGYGDTPKAAIEDFYIAHKEMQEELGADVVPEIEVSFKYDVASFLKTYCYPLTLAGLQVITGVNQKQLQHYLSGHRKPTDSTKKKIEKGVHDFAEMLLNVEFA